MSSSPPARDATRWTRFKDRALGAPGPQRARASHSLFAILVFIVFAGVQQVEVWGGLIDQFESNLLSAWNILGALSIFAFVRSGRNLRFSVDPSLSFAQCIFGVTSICGSYAITGPARGGIMAIMLLILVFGMFTLKPARIRQLSTLAILALGSVMLWKGITDPLRYPALVELTHALTLVILMSSIAVLSVRIGSMRSMLQRQKAELQHAVEENRRLATLDELTGLINRRHMGATLRAEHERQKRGGESMSIALIDIDFFKRVNDEHGHAAGDAVLREFAQLASATMRVGDTVSRWGGEEFLIVMPATGVAEAAHAIDRLRKEFSMRHFRSIDDTLRATFSAGIAMHLDLETVDEFVERADQCMYAAKAGGRNRVCADRADDFATSFAPTQAPLDFPMLQ